MKHKLTHTIAGTLIYLTHAVVTALPEYLFLRAVLAYPLDIGPLTLMLCALVALYMQWVKRVITPALVEAKLTNSVGTILATSLAVLSVPLTILYSSAPWPQFLAVLILSTCLALRAWSLFVYHGRVVTEQLRLAGKLPNKSRVPL